jgi:transposase InsO family protein
LKERDEVVDFVEYWSERSMVPRKTLCDWVGIGSNKLCAWRSRYGQEHAHNSSQPRDSWLLTWERDAIIAYYLTHREVGYRRLCYMMLDEGVVAVSPSSVYRVLSVQGLLRRWNGKPSKKGAGFNHPDGPHQHWHIDVSYVNLGGTFYYLIAILDGYSRFLVHWDLRESMATTDVQIVLQKARELYPEAHPRVISDNAKQFTAREMKEFFRLKGMTHVRTSPYYPQSNGKLERWNGTVKRECIRPMCPSTIEEARRVVARYVDEYNNRRLHSAIGFVTPRDKLLGIDKQIWAERRQKLADTRAQREHEHKLGLIHEGENSSLTQVMENSVSV